MNKDLYKILNEKQLRIRNALKDTSLSEERKTALQAQYDQIEYTLNGFMISTDNKRLAPVADLTALADISIEDLTDKCDCFVEAEGAYYAFDAEAETGDVAPGDSGEGDPGYWIRTAGGVSGTISGVDYIATVEYGIITALTEFFEEFTVTFPAYIGCSQADYLNVYNRAGEHFAVWLNMEAGRVEQFSIAFVTATFMTQGDYVNVYTAGEGGAPYRDWETFK